jgi:hypothetical protein
MPAGAPADSACSIHDRASYTSRWTGGLLAVARSAVRMIGAPDRLIDGFRSGPLARSSAHSVRFHDAFRFQPHCDSRAGSAPLPRCRPYPSGLQPNFQFIRDRECERLRNWCLRLQDLIRPYFKLSTAAFGSATFSLTRRRQIGAKRQKAHPATALHRAHLVVLDQMLRVFSCAPAPSAGDGS